MDIASRLWTGPVRVWSVLSEELVVHSTADTVWESWTMRGRVARSVKGAWSIAMDLARGEGENALRFLIVVALSRDHRSSTGLLLSLGRSFRRRKERARSVDVRDKTRSLPGGTWGSTRSYALLL